MKHKYKINDEVTYYDKFNDKRHFGKIKKLKFDKRSKPPSLNYLISFDVLYGSMNAVTGFYIKRIKYTVSEQVLECLISKEEIGGGYSGFPVFETINGNKGEKND